MCVCVNIIFNNGQLKEIFSFSSQAVEYLKKRTPGRAAGMIAAVWIMSAVICIPPLLGWKVDRPDEPFPTCQVIFYKMSHVYRSPQ